MRRRGTPSSAFPTCVLLVWMLSTLGVASKEVPTGMLFARRAVILMHETASCTLPDELPRGVARRDKAWAEEYREERHLDWTVGFFEPKLVKKSNKSLYKKLVRFWGSKVSLFSAAVPYLGSEYLQEANEEVRRCIIALLGDINERTLGSHSGSGAVSQAVCDVYFELAMKSNSREERLLLQQLVCDTDLSEEQYEAMMQAVLGRDAEDEVLRGSDISIIVAGVMAGRVSDDVFQGFLDVAGGKFGMRAQALTVEVPIFRRYGDGIMMPFYGNALRESAPRAETDRAALWLAKRVLAVVGNLERRSEIVPSLIDILRCNITPRLQYEAVRTLEIVLNTCPETAGYQQEWEVVRGEVLRIEIAEMRLAREMEARRDERSTSDPIEVPVEKGKMDSAGLEALKVLREYWMSWWEKAEPGWEAWAGPEWRLCEDYLGRLNGPTRRVSPGCSPTAGR